MNFPNALFCPEAVRCEAGCTLVAAGTNKIVCLQMGYGRIYIAVRRHFAYWKQLIDLI